MGLTLSSPAGRPRGRGAKAPRLACEVAGVIRISDDSSTESDAGLDSDFNSSPESLVDDDVVIVDAIGLPSDDRGPLCLPQRDPHGPGVLDRVERLKQGLLDKVRRLGRELPINTLDELIDKLGGPQRVAEEWVFWEPRGQQPLVSSSAREATTARGGLSSPMSLSPKSPSLPCAGLCSDHCLNAFLGCPGQDSSPTAWLCGRLQPAPPSFTFSPVSPQCRPLGHWLADSTRP
ncbi:hypothetical protein P7K49_032745 [Saguinus oedipus]|uniref:Uncharacterized protein n=1 Tax=Saguinus oedipus TaxID=9490 RepID=A0ABQ9TPY7_SAGOE|nr:hypothetical protein P7K49_032745 [Saguinus oedipus]